MVSCSLYRVAVVDVARLSKQQQETLMKVIISYTHRYVCTTYVHTFFNTAAYSLFIFVYFLNCLCRNLHVSFLCYISFGFSLFMLPTFVFGFWNFMFSKMCTNYLRICLCIRLYVHGFFMQQPLCCCLCNDLCRQHIKQ